MTARATSREREGQVVYFIRRLDGLTKIGTTCNLRKRVQELTRRYGHVVVLATIPGGYDLECAFHRRFKAVRYRRSEWFATRPEDLR